MKKKSIKNNFSKFSSQKSNAAKKEQFRQEKRAWKKEREEFFEKKRESERNKAHGTRDKAQESSLRAQRSKGDKVQEGKTVDAGGQLMPLNKFIAHSGICARRDAAEMVKSGKVKVNNELVTEPGHRVSAKDDVRVNGKKIFLAKDLVYILLNKPKDYITTTDDPQKRKTVLDLINRVTRERVYPVGRLDRNTSGVLLLTNDGELAQKLTHPSHEVRKIYAVTLNKPRDRMKSFYHKGTKDT